MINLRQQFKKEILSWSLLAFAMAAFEGGVAGVLVNHLYRGVVDDLWLNQAIAIVSGAPAIANLASPFWARIEQGRNKVKLVAFLSMFCSLSLLFYIFAPESSIGLFLAVCGSLFSRICWSGILTVRSAVWRANYPRYLRAKITASFTLPMAIILSVTGIFIGFISGYSKSYYHVFYLLLLLTGLCGAYLYQTLKIRNAQLLATKEVELEQVEGKFSIHTLIGILKSNRPFRSYMMAMFIFGSGNLMFIAPLILILNDQFHISQWQQIVITSSLPLAALPVTIGLWAKLLNKSHIIQYRAIHSWSFVVALGLFASSSIFDSSWVLWPASFAFGTAVAGAILGWNLGHHDFSSPERASHYMAVHVTLTGVRGLIMPVIGVNIYESLMLFNHDLGKYMLILPFLLSLTGAITFVLLAKKQKRNEAI